MLCHGLGLVTGLLLISLTSTSGRLARRELDAALHRHEIIGPITVLDTSAGGVAEPWSPEDVDDAAMPISLDVLFTLYVKRF